nr:hypothetical protein [uncultured Acetatifactor sp.]
MGKIKNPDVRFPGRASGLVSGFGDSIDFEAFIGGMFEWRWVVFCCFLLFFGFGALVLSLCFRVFDFLFGIFFMGFPLWDFYYPSFGYGGFKT